MACYKSTAKKTVKKTPVKRKTTTKKAAPKKVYKRTEFGKFLDHTSIKRFTLYNHKGTFTPSVLKSAITVSSGTNDATGRMTKKNWYILKKTVKSKYWKIPGNYDAYDEEDAYFTDAEVLAKMNRDLTNTKRAYAKDKSNLKTKRREIYVIYWK